MDKKTILKISFTKTIPIMCSYLFLGMAYGMMMEEAGFNWIYSFFSSTFVYTGAFQFVMITFLSSSASLLTVFVTALLMNSRQIFYSISFLEDFKKMKGKKLYMIHTLTDETYAVNLTLTKEERNNPQVLFYIALFSHIYWITGSVAGGVLGQLIPFDLNGIDFCMTALFIIIFVDQWEKADKHAPALIGLGVSIISLMIFDKSTFMLPALLICSAILLLMGKCENNQSNDNRKSDNNMTTEENSKEATNE